MVDFLNIYSLKGKLFQESNEFEFPAKIKSQIVKNWRVLEKKFNGQMLIKDFKHNF